MKGLIKTIVVLALLGGIGYGVYILFFSQGAAGSCTRVAKLCGGKLGGESMNKCKQVFVKLESAAGKKQLDKAHKCIAESETCPAAMGCIVGAGLGAAGEFFKGLQKSLGGK